MARLSEKDEQNILALITQWTNPKLGWVELIDACKAELGISVTRQALSTRPNFKMAIKDRKKALKAPSQAPGYVKDIKDANERIAKLEAENQLLRKVNNQLLVRFKRWQANADMHGLTESMLDQPMFKARR